MFPQDNSAVSGLVSECWREEAVFVEEQDEGMKVNLQVLLIVCFNA